MPPASSRGAISLVTDGLIIRRAKTGDVPAVVSLLIEDSISLGQEKEAAPTDPLYQHAFAAIDADPKQLLLVGELDGKVIATLQLTFLQYLMHRGRPIALVEAVRVGSPHRSKSIGAQLMKRAIDEAKERGWASPRATKG